MTTNETLKYCVKLGYHVDNDGKLYNPKGKQMMGNLSNTGYLRFNSPKIEGKRMVIAVHRLQAYHKFGDKIFEQDMVVRHLDGNPLNNSWGNIEIGTQSDNIFDIPQIKRRLMSSKGKRKHNYSAIRIDRAKGMSYKDLMLKYNIKSKGTISHIINSNMPSNY